MAIRFVFLSSLTKRFWKKQGISPNLADKKKGLKK
jgi:hypothetical protein